MAWRISRLQVTSLPMGYPLSVTSPVSGSTGRVKPRLSTVEMFSIRYPSTSAVARVAAVRATSTCPARAAARAASSSIKTMVTRFMAGTSP